MNLEKIPNFFPHALYMAAITGYFLLIVLAPYLESTGSPLAPVVYEFFASQCHQLTSRSLCIYPQSLAVSDCLPQDRTLAFTKQNEVTSASLGPGFKLAMCARDTGIFFGMIVGGLAAPFVVGLTGRKWPSKWLLAAAVVPIAIDGTVQLLGFKESTNTERLATGLVIGVVMPLYIIPIMNQIWWSLTEGRKARASAKDARHGHSPRRKALAEKKQ